MGESWLARFGGEYPRVARDQPAVLAHQRRRRPAPLLDARGYRGDLGIRVGPPATAFDFRPPLLGNRRHVVRIRQPLGPLGQQIL